MRLVVEDIIPLLSLHEHQQAVADDAGVVHQDVHRAELGTYATEECLDRLFVSDVTLSCERSDALFPDERGRFETGVRAFAIADRDRGAPARESQGNGPPNATGASGDDGHAACECQVVHATWPVPGRTFL